MTKSELLKYIDTMLTQRSDGNIGLLRVRQYVEDNMEDMARCKDCKYFSEDLCDRFKVFGLEAEDYCSMWEGKG